MKNSDKVKKNAETISESEEEKQLEKVKEGPSHHLKKETESEKLVDEEDIQLQFEILGQLKISSEISIAYYEVI